jgi:hypothetical protein
MDPLKPSITLLVKLGSIIVHQQEAMSPNGHSFDSHTFNLLLQDPEVIEWLKAMDAAAFLPKMR